MTVEWHPLKTCPKDGKAFMIGNVGSVAHAIVTRVDVFSDDPDYFKFCIVGTNVIFVPRDPSTKRWARLPAVTS